jgi:hypothetical protein
MSRARRLLHLIAERIQWMAALDKARREETGKGPPDLSATGRAA